MNKGIFVISAGIVVMIAATVVSICGYTFGDSNIFVGPVIFWWGLCAFIAGFILKPAYLVKKPEHHIEIIDEPRILSEKRELLSFQHDVYCLLKLEDWEDGPKKVCDFVKKNRNLFTENELNLFILKRGTKFLVADVFKRDNGQVEMNVRGFLLVNVAFNSFHHRLVLPIVQTCGNPGIVKKIWV